MNKRTEFSSVYRVYFVSIFMWRRGADKSLAFLLFSTTKRIFLGWVKEIRTTKSLVCGAQGGICRVNKFFQSRSLFSL
jgi:hypothetical protein